MSLSFEEFPAVSKTQWLKTLEKSLKGAAPESLNWEVCESISVSPLVHADDFPDKPVPLHYGQNNWQICELIPVSDPVFANKMALEALQGGAESIEFQLDDNKNIDIQFLLNGIYAEFISLHFSGSGIEADPLGFIAAIGKYSRKNNWQLKGSVLEASGTDAWMADSAVLETATQLPEMRLFGFKPKTAIAELSEGIDQITVLLRDANTCLEKLKTKGWDINAAANQMHFEIHIGTSFFWEIARLRAFKIAWLNVLKAWNAELKYPVISLRFSENAYTDDLYGNMIRSSAMCLSGAIGGADRITVRPHDAGREGQSKYSPEFSRRIARNVQNLLKMEAYMDQVADPAAGAYYIEQLTDKFIRMIRI